MGATKLPQDCAVLTGDLVNGASVTCGDEVVTGSVFVDGVDVEVVPG